MLIVHVLLPWDMEIFQRMIRAKKRAGLHSALAGSSHTKSWVKAFGSSGLVTWGERELAFITMLLLCCM